MALSEMSIRHARITGIDYTLGDSDGLTLRIEQRKALTTAEKCRTWFNQLFRYALAKIEGVGTQPGFGSRCCRTTQTSGCAQSISSYGRTSCVDGCSPKLWRRRPSSTWPSVVVADRCSHGRAALGDTHPLDLKKTMAKITIVSCSGVGFSSAAQIIQESA